MKEVLVKALVKNLWFYILSGIAIAFLIASFLLPPMGIIQPSVLQAVGELFAFGGLGTVVKAIDTGKTASVKHNNTEITINDKEK